MDKFLNVKARYHPEEESHYKVMKYTDFPFLNAHQTTDNKREIKR